MDIPDWDKVLANKDHKHRNLVHQVYPDHTSLGDKKGHTEDRAHKDHNKDRPARTVHMVHKVHKVHRVHKAHTARNNLQVRRERMGTGRKEDSSVVWCKLGNTGILQRPTFALEAGLYGRQYSGGILARPLCNIPVHPYIQILDSDPKINKILSYVFVNNTILEIKLKNIKKRKTKYL